VGVAEDWDTYFQRTLKSPGSFLGSLVLNKKIPMMKKGLDVVWLITLSFTSEKKIFASPSMLRPHVHSEVAWHLALPPVSAPATPRGN